ncbi:MAG: hypothetical protein LBE27_04170 [Deltaproteobacteria bacterium]|nr:hypothetical protein [Deltaproteobacteria bacterium]
MSLSIPIGGLVKNPLLFSSTNVSIKNTLSNSTLKIGSIGVKVTSGATEETKTSLLTLSFTESLLKNLETANAILDEENKRVNKEKERLAKAIVDTAAEVEKNYGKAEATKFMAMVLTNTETTVTESRLAGAVSEFLLSIKTKAESELASAKNAEETKEAEKALEKLKGLRDYINGEGDDDNDGLAAAINSYFGREKVADDDKKSFTEDFVWISANELKAQQEAEKEKEAYPSFYIAKGELDNEVYIIATNYLSETVRSVEATTVFQNLEDDDDIFDAVDQVRSILEKEDEEASGTIVSQSSETEKEEAAEAVKVAAALPTTAESATVNTVSSNAVKVFEAAVNAQTKSALFNQFLNNYFLTEINNTISENKEVGERLTHTISFSTGVEYSFGTVGISSWPGLVAVQSQGLSISVGFEREFSISVGKDNKIETKFSQSLKVEASFKSSTVIATGGGVIAAGAYLTLAQELESRYTAGKISVGTFNTGQAVRSSYLLSSVI